MAKHRAVVLVGFMGAGKTSVGQALASALGWSFIDLDDRVETREDRSVAEIFRDSGEAAFRQAETAALHDLLDGLEHDPPTVIAVGGGAFVQEENARLLAGTGAPVVFLDAPPDVLRRRCRPQAAARPLFQDEERFQQLYEARRPQYLRAGLRIDTTRCTVPQVAAEIIERLQLGR